MKTIAAAALAALTLAAPAAARDTIQAPVTLDTPTLATADWQKRIGPGKAATAPWCTRHANVADVGAYTAAGGQFAPTTHNPRTGNNEWIAPVGKVTWDGAKFRNRTPYAVIVATWC